MAVVAHTALTNAFIVGITVGTGVITARLLGPSGRGEQAAITLYPLLLSTGLTLGLPSAVLYSLKRYPDRGSELFSAALLLGILMGAVGTVVGVLFIPHWLTEYRPDVVHFAQWSMLTVPLGLLTLMFQFVLQAREEFSLYNATRYAIFLLILLVLGLLALAGDLTPFNSALAYLLAPVPVFLWMLRRLWRLYQPTWRSLSWPFRRLISYGARSSGIDFLTQISLQLDRVLVVGFLSPAAMGLYTVAWSMAQSLGHVFQLAVVAVLFPKASGRSKEEVVSLTGLATRGFIALSVPAAAGLMLFSPWVLSLIYGSEYTDAVPVFRLLLVAAVLSSTNLVLLQAFMALNRPGLVTIEQVAGLGLILPLLLVLLPRYGLVGVGLALIISAVIRFVLVLISFPLVLKVRIPRLWLTREDLVSIARRSHISENKP